MKKLFLFLFTLILISPVLVRAEYDQFDQSVQVSLGGTTGAYRYYDALSTAGIDFGAAYRIYPFQNTRVSLGVELQRSSFKDKPTSDYDERKDVTLLSGGGFARYDLTPASNYITYLSGGLLLLDFTRDSHTPAGTTTETNSRGGYFCALGVDLPVALNWRMGVEVRTIGDTDYFVEAITGKFTLAYIWSHL